MERIIRAATEPGDVIWEPFGGLASGSVAAVALGRRPFAAELDAEFAALANERLTVAAAEANPTLEEEAIETARTANGTGDDGSNA